MPSANTAPNTLGDVVARCQSIMGDRSGRWVTRDYALPFIQQAYESMTNMIKNASGKNFEAVIEALAVPGGTSDLSGLQSLGDPTQQPAIQPGPFAGLSDPIRMWTKTAGALPCYYTQANGPRDTLPNTINPPGLIPGNFATVVTFAWIGNRLSITMVAGAIDIQLYARFNPPRLQKDEDPLLLYPNMTAALAYSTCAIMGVERSNPAVLQGYAIAAQADIDNIVADIIRQCQRNPRRLASMGGRGGTCYGWGSGW